MSSDKEKMEALQAKHARKKAEASATKKPTIYTKNLADWEIDPRPAQLICPRCGEKREGQRPKGMWKMAAARGEEKPVWKAICKRCDTQEGKQKAEKKRDDDDGSIAPQLFLPEERR